MRILLDKFDSELTGKRCGILDVRPPVPDIAEIRALCEPWDHVRAVKGMDGAIGWHHIADHLHLAGFYLSSVRVTFESAGTWPVMLGAELRPPEPSETDFLLSGTVGQRFDKSRFSTDRFYEGCALLAHQTWIRNLLGAKRVYVLPDADEPGHPIHAFGKGLGGFVGYSLDYDGDATILEIDLIAAFSSGRGTGRQMMTDLARKVPHTHVRAKTQIYNERAVRLYRALGMEQTRTEAIFAWRRR